MRGKEKRRFLLASFSTLSALAHQKDNQEAKDRKKERVKIQL